MQRPSVDAVNVEKKHDVVFRAWIKLNFHFWSTIYTSGGEVQFSCCRLQKKCKHKTEFIKGSIWTLGGITNTLFSCHCFVLLDAPTTTRKKRDNMQIFPLFQLQMEKQKNWIFFTFSSDFVFYLFGFRNKTRNYCNSAKKHERNGWNSNENGFIILGRLRWALQWRKNVFTNVKRHHEGSSVCIGELVSFRANTCVSGEQLYELMVYGNFYANFYSHLLTVLFHFFLVCGPRWKCGSWNMRIGNSTQKKKRYNFHMNLYETWIYYDFLPPQTLPTSRLCFVLWKSGREKKIQIIFAKQITRGMNVLGERVMFVRDENKFHKFQEKTFSGAGNL